MNELKLTCWNIEWLGRIWPRISGSKYHSDRRVTVANEILAIDPDILCIEEGPPDPQDMISYAQAFLPGYEVVVRPDGQSWGLKGDQWIYFLVKIGRVDNPMLMNIEEWYDKMPKNRGFNRSGSKWNVHYWGDLETETHGHYRLPQVLRFSWNGQAMEIIGAHLKSKINFHSAFDKQNGTWNKAFIDTALKARIKLATEAASIRHYIDARFREEPDPAIFVMGDFNDGPGKERIEREFMFFDLISVLQGDVFFSRKFLNHALFDYSQELRWSTKFKDKTDPERPETILLDHILFTQALVNGTIKPHIKAKSGSVEHAAHNRANAGMSKSRTSSDHRAVSVIISVDEQ
jgi:hypothetical protein